MLCFHGRPQLVRQMWMFALVRPHSGIAANNLFFYVIVFYLLSFRSQVSQTV